MPRRELVRELRCNLVPAFNQDIPVLAGRLRPVQLFRCYQYVTGTGTPASRSNLVLF